MEKKRLLQTIRLWTILGSSKRTEYLKKNHVFAEIGTNCSVMDRKIPLYANLVKLGNNVHIASKVDFVTHDITHVMLNGRQELDSKKYSEKVGCIEIGDNVFVGTKTTILYDVKIGSNVIIGAGSLVNKDIPDNSVAAGVPVKVIGTLDNYLIKRNNEEGYPIELKPVGQRVSKELEQYLWNAFDKKHNKKTEN